MISVELYSQFCVHHMHYVCVSPSTQPRTTDHGVILRPMLRITLELSGSTQMAGIASAKPCPQWVASTSLTQTLVLGSVACIWRSCPPRYVCYPQEWSSKCHPGIGGKLNIGRNDDTDQFFRSFMSLLSTRTVPAAAVPLVTARGALHDPKGVLWKTF